MNENQQLKIFEQESDYFEYLLSTVRKPYHKGLLKNIEKRIEVLKEFIKAENSPDRKMRAEIILEKYETLKQRFHLIHTKKRK